MKITYLLTQNLESPYGVGRCWPLARELASLGHQIQILALHPDFTSVNPRCFEIEGVRVQYVAPMHVIKKGNKKDYYPSYQLVGIAAKATLNLTNAALRQPSDILHICKPHPMNSLAGLIACLGRNRLLFLDCDDYEAASGNFSARWQKWLIAAFERNMPRHVQIVTTNTHFMASKLETWGIPKQRIKYLSNGVDPDRFTQPDSNQVNELRNQLDLHGKKVISYIGSLSLVNHAVDILLIAFTKVLLAFPDARLLIVGTGEDMDNLQAQARMLGIQNAVIWIGKVAPKQVVAYYHLSDVSIDPVRDDDANRGRSPLKLFESWACGVPFVTGAVGDRKLLLGDPPAGVLAEASNADSLAESILQVLTNPRLAGECRQRGQKQVQTYTWDKLAKQVAMVYQSALDTHLTKKTR